MPRYVSKLVALLLTCSLLFQQTLPAGRQAAFAQLAPSVDIAAGLARIPVPDRFRPIHLRFLSYNDTAGNFQLLLDRGDLKDPGSALLSDSTKLLMDYFFIGLALPNEAFWVNLSPDAPERILDDHLATTELGRVLLEADVQLKRDTARATSPETPEGRQYWTKLYAKADELFSQAEDIDIPAVVRPWIVPGEILIREAGSSAYIYKATLKVMLEEDYIKSAGRDGLNRPYQFADPRLKALNEYSSKLLNELIIPTLTRQVNASKRYAPLRQVYYSLIMAQWFKARMGAVPKLIDSGNLTGLTSQKPWDKKAYFKQYLKSFKGGEYRLQDTVATSFGETTRTYVSGGIRMGITSFPGLGASSAAVTSIDGNNKNNIVRLPQGIVASFDRSTISVEGAASSAATAAQLPAKKKSWVAALFDTFVPQRREASFPAPQKITGRDFQGHPVLQAFAELNPGGTIDILDDLLFYDTSDRQSENDSNVGRALAALDSIPGGNFVAVMIKHSGRDASNCIFIIDKVEAIQNYIRAGLNNPLNLGSFGGFFFKFDFTKDRVHFDLIEFYNDDLKGKGLGTLAQLKVIELLSREYAGMTVTAHAYNPIVLGWFAKYLQGRFMNFEYMVKDDRQFDERVRGSTSYDRLFTTLYDLGLFSSGELNELLGIGAKIRGEKLNVILEKKGGLLRLYEAIRDNQNRFTDLPVFPLMGVIPANFNAAQAAAQSAAVSAEVGSVVSSPGAITARGISTPSQMARRQFLRLGLLLPEVVKAGLKIIHESELSIPELLKQFDLDQLSNIAIESKDARRAQEAYAAIESVLRDPEAGDYYYRIAIMIIERIAKMRPELIKPSTISALIGLLRQEGFSPSLYMNAGSAFETIYKSEYNAAHNLISASQRAANDRFIPREILPEPPQVKQPLINKIKALIAENNGRIPFSQFMRLCLYEATHGYYTSGTAKVNHSIEWAGGKRVFRWGDFQTYPDMYSPLFGRGLARQLFQMWQIMGSPASFTVVEMGAGSGVLARDILRAARKLDPAFYKALTYTIVDISGKLNDKQRATLQGFTDKVTVQQGSAVDLTTTDFRNFQGVFLSNELPDAFPIDRIRIEKGGRLAKAFIALDAQGRFIEQWRELSPGDSEFGYIDTVRRIEGIDSLEEFVKKYGEGFEFPVSASAQRWYENLAGILRAGRGYLITIDYGVDYFIQYGQSREQAVRTYHSYDRSENALRTHPGSVDITSSVYFSMLREAAERAPAPDTKGLTFMGLVPQMSFMQNLINKSLGDPSFEVLIHASNVPTDTQLIGTSGSSPAAGATGQDQTGAVRASASSSPVQGLSPEERDLLTGAGVDEALLALIGGGLARVQDEYERLTYLTQLARLLAAVPASHAAQELKAIIVRELVNKREPTRLPDIFELGAQEFQAYFFFSKMLQELFKAGGKYGFVVTAGMLQNLLSCNAFDARIVGTVLDFLNTGENADSAYAQEIVRALIAGIDINRASVRRSIGEYLIETRTKQRNIVTSWDTEDFRNAFYSREEGMPLGEAMTQFSETLFGHGLEPEFTIAGERVVNLGHPRVQEFIAGNNIVLLPPSPWIATRWTTKNLLTHARNKFSGPVPDISIFISESGKIYSVKETASIAAADNERSQLVSSLGERVIQGTGKYVVSEYLVDYVDFGLYGPDLVAMTGVQLDTSRREISRRIAVISQGVPDNRPSNYMVKVTIFGDVIDIRPIDFGQVSSSAGASSASFASNAIRIMYETDHYRRAQFRDELQSGVQEADVVVLEFPEELSSLLQQLSDGAIDVDTFTSLMAAEYGRLGAGEMVFDNENRILYDIIRGSGKIVVGAERLQAGIVNTGGAERRLNEALHSGEFEEALDSFVELLLFTASWIRGRENHARQVLRQARQQYPQKRILYIGGSLHTFIGNVLEAQGMEVERLFIGRRPGEPLAVFRYDDALVRLFMHDMERNRQPQVSADFAARALLTNIWINVLKSQGRRASANFLQMNRAVSQLSFEEIRTLVLNLVGRRRAWTSIERQLLELADRVRPSTAGSPASVSADRIQTVSAILRDGQVRPDPLVVAGLTRDDIVSVAGRQEVESLEAKLTFKELDNILPYLRVVVEHIINNFPGHKLLILGRDAELIYDALRVMLAGTPRADDVILFPGSTSFWGRFAMLPRQTRERFLASYGITKEALSSGQKFLIFDSGFYGSIAGRMHMDLAELFGLDVAVVRDAMPARLLSVRPDSIVDPLGAPLSVDASQRDAIFPKTSAFYERGLQNWFTRLLAISLQLMPHHHGHYLGLTEENGNLKFIIEAAEQEFNIDRFLSLNHSSVHPLAALLAQQRVASYFDNVKRAASPASENAQAQSVVSRSRDGEDRLARGISGSSSSAASPAGRALEDTLVDALEGNGALAGRVDDYLQAIYAGLAPVVDPAGDPADYFVDGYLAPGGLAAGTLQRIREAFRAVVAESSDQPLDVRLVYALDAALRRVQFPRSAVIPAAQMQEIGTTPSSLDGQFLRSFTIAFRSVAIAGQAQVMPAYSRLNIDVDQHGVVSARVADRGGTGEGEPIRTFSLGERFETGRSDDSSYPIVLRVHRQGNTYSFDIQNYDPLMEVFIQWSQPLVRDRQVIDENIGMLKALMQSRRRVYERFATIIVDQNGRLVYARDLDNNRLIGTARGYVAGDRVISIQWPSILEVTEVARAQSVDAVYPADVLQQRLHPNLAEAIRTLNTPGTSSPASENSPGHKSSSSASQAVSTIIQQAKATFNANTPAQCVGASRWIAGELDKVGIKNSTRRIHIPFDASKTPEIGDATTEHTVVEADFDGIVWVIDTQLIQFTMPDRNKLSLPEGFVLRAMYSAEEYYKVVPAYAVSIVLESERITAALKDATSSSAAATVAQARAIRSETPGVSDDQGGIDFRALPVSIQPQAAASGALLPFISIQLNQNWSRIRDMLDRGVMPSAKTIADSFIADSEGQVEVDMVNQALVVVADILRAEEEACCSTDNSLRQILTLLESGKPAGELRAAFSKL